MKPKGMLVMVPLLAIRLTAASASETSFQGLGDLPGGSFYSRPFDVSSNGSVVVGFSISASSDPFEAFHWTEAGGMVGLGSLPGGDFHSVARGVSADGTVVVGYSSSELSQPDDEAFRWTEAGGMVGLGGLPGGDFRSYAMGTSANGTVVVGYGFVEGGETWWSPEAFRWTEAGGMVGLGSLPGGHFPLASKAFDVSADGAVVVGESSSESSGDYNEAFRWTQADGMVGLGDLPGGDFHSSARSVSADGSLIVGDGNITPVNPAEAFRWTQAGGMAGLGDLPGGSFWSDATGISADGSVVVGRSISANGWEAFIWTEETGLVSLRDLLVQSYCLDLSGWTLRNAWDVSPDGRMIVGDGTNPSGQTEAWIVALCPDQDGDGLCDDWEVSGLDCDGDGTIDLTLVGADLEHKDLYVEIDAMAGLAPDAGALSMVVSAFANAPVDNPDGTTGINLHLDIDETDIPVAAWPNAWDGFEAVKEVRFCTAAQRSDPNYDNILAAKEKAYRYCIFASSHSGSTSSGLAELPGDDFMVTLGLWTTPGGTVEQQASTFMHELGHTLGLDHGGDDDINFKPNYYSIMNYMWQIRIPAAIAGTAPELQAVHDSWQLDYSHSAFPTLEENALDEDAGLAGNAGVSLLVGPPMGRLAAQVVRMGGPVDWNRDGDTVDTGVAADISRIYWRDPASPGQLLEGHDDWGNLRFLRGHANFERGVHERFPTDELTLEMYQMMFDPCTGDFDGDTNIDRDDFTAFGICMTGPEGGPVGLECQCGDFDGDEDVDLADFGWLQVAFTGPLP